MTRSEAVPAPKIWRVGTLVYTSTGLMVVFFWLLCGDFVFNLKERAVIPVAQLMLRGFDSSDLLVGLLVSSLPAGLGMIIGPFISVKSDRHRGKWGRRIPYILIPTPFIVLSMAALGSAPFLATYLDGLLGASSPGRAVLGTLLFVVFWIVFEVASVVANIIFMALTTDVVPQVLIGRFFGLFRMVGLMAAIMFNFTIIGYSESHYFEIFLGTGLLYGAGFVVMCLRVKEGEYPPPSPMASTDHRPLARITDYFKECYSLSYYRWLFAAATLGALASIPVNSFSVFFARSLGMDLTSYGKCLVLTFAISIVLSYPVGALADRLHPLRLGIGVTILYAIAMVWAGFAATTASSFSAFFVAHGVIAGTYVTATASLGQRLYPQMKFAQFASAWGIVLGFGMMVTTPLAGMVLDATGHNYRLTFFASGLIAVVGVGALFVTHRHFMRLGGPDRYMAPAANL